VKIYIDRDKVNARASLATVMSVGGLLLLLGSVLLPLFVAAAANIALLLLAAGGIIAMVGIYYSNRWVRKPRPEDSLDAALKAFDDHYRLFHYPKLPCDHVLLTPSGAVAFEVVNLTGSFSNRRGRWKESMTIGRALRYIVEPRVADPLLVAQALTDELASSFAQELGAGIDVPIKALTVFTHPAVDLEVEGAAYPACKVGKLRKQANLAGPRLPDVTYDKLASYLERLTLG
jgi:Nuclease-related domain